MTRSYRALSRLAEQSIAKSGLCLTDFAALEALLHKGPLTITEIQEKVLLASGSMTAAIDRVEQFGLVVRKASAADRRARLIELTREGKQVAASCFERHTRDLECVLSVLSVDEKEQMYSSLKTLGLFAAGKQSAGRPVSSQDEQQASIPVRIEKRGAFGKLSDVKVTIVCADTFFANQSMKRQDAERFSESTSQAALWEKAQVSKIAVASRAPLARALRRFSNAVNAGDGET
jgi:MarR family 2-MHQ and catechol resistance regulon transcriptional repressor